MFRFSWALVAVFPFLSNPAAALDPAKPATLDIYFVNVGRGVGNATLIVAPSGETMILDAGPEYAANRVLNVIKKAGVKQIDYLVTTHYHADHCGATGAIGAQVPIRQYVDHGTSVELGKDDAWWKERRGPWFKDGMGKDYDKRYKQYTDARENSRHVIVKAGDTIPVKGLEVNVLCSGGKVLEKPLPGAGQPIPAGEKVERRGEDDAEDAQSIGVRVGLGKFHFVYLGDLTWNLEDALFSPVNKVGTVDAYLVTHHAQSFPKEHGDYYHGLSACPKSEVFGLRPRVAILSLGATGHRQGTPEAMETVRSSPGLEDVWQTNWIEAGGEKEHNAPKEFCASIGMMGAKEGTSYIKLSANEDGSFSVENSRNQFTKTYGVKK